MAVIKVNSKRWVVDIYVGGREGKRIRRGFPEKKMAMAFERKMKLAEFTGDIIEPQKANITISTLIDKYKTIHDAANTEETRKRNNRILKIIADELGDLSLRSITRETIETYKANRLKKVKPVTVNIELRILRSLLNRAVEWHYLKHSPASKIKLVRIDEAQPRFLLPAEAIKVIDCAFGQMKTFIVMGLYTGLRRGEMFRLEWGDIDYQSKVLIVRKSKGRKFRQVPMNDQLIEILMKHPKHITSPLVFHYRDGSGWKDPRTAFNNAFDRAGVDRIRIHDLRHSFVSGLVAAGVDLRTVKELAGHANIQTTMRYAHLAPGRLQESVSKLKWG